MVMFLLGSSCLLGKGFRRLFADDDRVVDGEFMLSGRGFRGAFLLDGRVFFLMVMTMIPQNNEC